MPHTHTEFVVGERIPGTKYVLCGLLGQGGMGVVYEVVKPPGIRGAMKVMHPSMRAQGDCVARFFNEVALLAALRHRNIVAVHDFDQLRDGTPFVVMEKLEGETLRTTLRKTPKGFPARVAYEVVRQACEALYRAHSQPTPVVHRDIKPENLFLSQVPGSEEVELKVLDFGVAALAGAGRSRGHFGTPKYMAPEQFRGEPVTPKADLYALALVLYEMLTGRLPWKLESEADLYRAHTSLTPPPPSRYAPWVPRSVDELMGRALAKDPAARPHSAFALASQLYELQWARDAHSRSTDANTTAPTLTALVTGFAEGGDGAARTNRSQAIDTLRGMTPPAVEGPSLEVLFSQEPRLPDDTEAAPGPAFSMAAWTPSPLATPRSPDGVDRLATTREMAPWSPSPPTHDTMPMGDPALTAHAVSRPPADPEDGRRQAGEAEATAVASSVAPVAFPSVARIRVRSSRSATPLLVFVGVVGAGSGAAAFLNGRSAPPPSPDATARIGVLQEESASRVIPARRVEMPGLASTTPVLTASAATASTVPASAAPAARPSVAATPRRSASAGKPDAGAKGLFETY